MAFKLHMKVRALEQASFEPLTPLENCSDVGFQAPSEEGKNACFPGIISHCSNVLKEKGNYGVSSALERSKPFEKGLYEQVAYQTSECAVNRLQ